jgi:Arm DNA-binding domain
VPAIDQLRDKWVRAVATLKPQEDFWDESRPGLFLRVSRSGSKTFFYSYRRPGPGPARERPKAALLLGKFAPDDPRPEVRFGLSDAVTAWRAASWRLAEGTEPKPPQAEPVPANTVSRVRASRTSRKPPQTPRGLPIPSRRPSASLIRAGPRRRSGRAGQNGPFCWREPAPGAVPADRKVAFWPMTRLAPLVREGKIRSLDLTRMYLQRLHLPW